MKLFIMTFSPLRCYIVILLVHHVTGRLCEVESLAYPVGGLGGSTPPPEIIPKF
jgi:hypothetical protein